MSQAPLPSNPPVIDLDDIQGDVLQGLTKTHQSFLFFRISDPNAFRRHLKGFVRHITTTTQALQQRDIIADHKAHGRPGLAKIVGVNIAFSQKGLDKLGISDNLNDAPFKAGQQADAKANLGDPLAGDSPDWEKVFLTELHAVFLVTAESKPSLQEQLDDIEEIFGNSILLLANVHGVVRPNKKGPDGQILRGKEHFGFRDGISQPGIIGFPGAADAIAKEKGIGTQPGVIVVGLPGDVDVSGKSVVRPPWAKNGSFLVFRKLRQFVPEFSQFLKENAVSGVSNGADLRGARLVGRWPSGASLVLNPTSDPGSGAPLADDTINNFDYTEDPAENICPFSAHVRKTNPRAGFPHGDAVQKRRINRQGIPYGPEVDQLELNSQASQHDRGLLFACYQSNIQIGFQFVQQTWANLTGFPASFDPSVAPDDKQPSGFDPLIGQAGFSSRFVKGIKGENTPLILPNLFVQPLGGEYFFSPSLSALKGPLFSSA